MSSVGGGNKDATIAAQSDRTLRLAAEDKLKRDKMKTQNLFIRQMRGQQSGGFFNAPPGDTLG